MARGRRTNRTARLEPYKHPEADSPMRPEVGTQARFKKKKPPQTYRYDSSLSPALDWDGQNPAREQGEQHLAVASERLSEVRRKLSETDDWQLVAGSVAEAEEALGKLQAMSGPFLNWAGKAERLSFDVPTLPLFVHERLSTKAIIETLKGHKRDRQMDMFSVRRPPAFDHRSGAARLRASRQVDQPDDPRRFAGGDELAAAVRRTGRAGTDDLHGPALWREVRQSTFSRSFASAT